MLLLLVQTTLAQETGWSEVAQLPGLAPDPAPDCALSAPEHKRLWHRLRELSRAEGQSVGVVANGPGCQRALDAAIRSGPFPGVHRIEPDSPEAQDRCVAVLRPSEGGGWRLDTNGHCRAGQPSEEPSGDTARVVTVAWWLPVGASARWNEDLGAGVSAVLDLAFRDPDLYEVDPYGLYLNAPLELASSSRQLRLLGGIDLGRRGMDGGYLGLRGGAQWLRPNSDGVFRAQGRHGTGVGVLSTVIGRKWIDDALVSQVGIGVEANLPLAARPDFLWLGPVLELRMGLGSQD